MAVVIASPPQSRRWAPIALALPRLPVELIKLIPLLLALLASPALYLSVTSEAVTVGASIERINRERDHWRQQNRQLELELSKLQSLTWVENEAVTRLGMQRATPALFLKVERHAPPAARSLPSTLARTENPTGRTNLQRPRVVESETSQLASGSR